jgi:hypothetical protein
MARIQERTAHDYAAGYRRSRDPAPQYFDREENQGRQDEERGGRDDRHEDHGNGWDKPPRAERPELLRRRSREDPHDSRDEDPRAREVRREERRKRRKRAHRRSSSSSREEDRRGSSSRERRRRSRSRRRRSPGKEPRRSRRLH